MKKSKLFLTISVLFLFGTLASAQTRYDVRFVLDNIDCNTRLACWNVQVKSGASSATSSFGLGDQNYRLFWDSDLMTFASSESLIISNGYTAASNKNTSENVDGSDKSQLSFKDNFGFHEYAINWTKGASSLTIDDWTTTSKVCFNIKPAVDLGDPSSCVEIIWGRDGVTDEHTIAFVTMSYIDNANLTTPASLEVADDLTPADGNDACFHTSCPDIIPSFSVSDIVVNEDDGTATVQVCLSSRSSETLTVDYATANGTATSGLDYTGISTQTLSFAPGDSCKSVTVTINDDTLDEGDEDFFVDLSNPSSNATVSKSRGTIDVKDNDTTPSISISDMTVDEDDGTATVQVCLSNKSSNTVTVDYATSNGTATSGLDYTGISTQTLSFAPGDSCKPVTVTIIDDTLDEGDEDLSINLSNPSNATLANSVGTINITDNDDQPKISVGNATVTEGGTAKVQVCIDAISSNPVTFSFQTSDGTATSGDYSSVNNNYVIPAGSSCIDVDVVTLDDSNVENTETINVKILNVGGADIANSNGSIMITDNDVLPTCNAQAPTITIGNN